MNAKIKTTRGKPKTQKAQAMRQPAAPKPVEKKTVRKNKRIAQPQIENILERVSDGFVAFDAEMNYTYVNERGGEMLGRAPEDLIGKNYWVEYPEAKGSVFANAYARALKEQTALEIEDYYQPFDRWFENRIYPSKDGLSIFFHDITDRKKAELALREQERLTSAITNTTPALIYLHDMETQSNVYSNSGIEQLLGFSPKEIQAMGAEVFVRLIHPDDLRNVIDFQSKIMAAKDTDILEIEYRMKDQEGGWHTLHSYERPFLRNPDDSLKQKLGVAIDVTDHKRVQEELQRSEQVLRLFVENSPASIAMFDRKMRYIVASRRYLIDYELGEQNVVGRSHYEIFPEIPERWKEIHRRCLAGAIEKADEDPFPRLSGKMDWIRWEIRPWHEADGEIGGVILFSEVITEHRQAQEDLRLSQERFSNAFHSSPAGVSITRITDGKFIEVNEAFLDMFEYSRGEMIGRASTELNIISPEARARLIQAQIETGGLRNAELASQSKSGRPIHLLFSSAAIEMDGESCLITTMVDITEQKKAGEELRLSEERFSNAFHTSPAGLTITRIADGKFIEANASFCRMFEFNRDEVIGHTSTELNMWTPEERKKLIDEQIRSGGLHDFELQARAKSGRVANILFSSKPMEIGGETHHVTTMIDITERKSAAEVLQKHANELSALYNTSQSLQKLLTPEALSQEIVELLEKTLSYEYGAVLLIEEPGRSMIPFAIVGLERGDKFIQRDKEYIASHSVEVGKGITGWVAEHGESALIADVRQDPRYYGLRENIRSEMCAPLRIGERVIGVINVESPNLNAYNTNDLRVLETVAAQIGVSIQNARLLEEEQKRRKEAESLQQATAAISSSLDLKNILETLLEQLSVVVPLDSAAVILQEKERLTVVAAQGFSHPERVIGLEFPMDNPLTNILKETRRFIIIPDVRAEERFQQWGETSLIHGWMGIPLIVQEEVIGYLTVDSQTVDAYNESHARLAQSFANQAAVAIQNARLLEETRLSRNRLADLSRKLVETHEAEQRAIGRELHDQIGQMLTALKLTMETARLLPAEKASQKNLQAQELVNEMLARISALTLELRPPMLDDLGLIPALTWHVNRYQEQTRIQVKFKHSGVEGKRFPTEIETTAYRIAQEALTNVARHAGAARARLEVHAGGGMLSLEIEDNGRGFDPQTEIENPHSSGLKGMRERAALVGGSLQIESQPGRGAREFIQLPLPAEDS